jgi:hypothetical protein
VAKKLNFCLDKNPDATTYGCYMRALTIHIAVYPTERLRGDIVADD